MENILKKFMDFIKKIFNKEKQEQIPEQISEKVEQNMWNIQLTKADKRHCRELIHIGLERECEQYVKEMQQLANKPIPLAELNEPYREENGFSVEGPWHKRYIALYKKTR